MKGKEKGAVGKNRRKRNLDLCIVDSLCKFAYKISKGKSQQRTTCHAQHELFSARNQRDSPGNCTGEKNLEQSNGRAVIQQTLALYKYRKSLVNPHFLENG